MTSSTFTDSFVNVVFCALWLLVSEGSVVLGDLDIDSFWGNDCRRYKAIKMHE